MEPLTLAEIRAEIERRAALIGAPAKDLPTYGRTEDFARPHVEADSRGYHYVVVERGVELKRVTTRELEELLYQVFRSVTSYLAGIGPRVKGEDVRRQMFRRQIEMLGRLDAKWAERGMEEVREILREHPFVDCE
jgi:hypothetical protein